MASFNLQRFSFKNSVLAKGFLQYMMQRRFALSNPSLFAYPRCRFLLIRVARGCRAPFRASPLTSKSMLLAIRGLF
jgi:hypothetical protein